MDKKKIFPAILPDSFKSLIYEEKKGIVTEKTIEMHVIKGMKETMQVRTSEAVRKNVWRNKGNNRLKENERRRKRNKEKRKTESEEQRIMRLQKRRENEKAKNLKSIRPIIWIPQDIVHDDCVGKYTVQEDTEVLTIRKKFIT